MAVTEAQPDTLLAPRTWQWWVALGMAYGMLAWGSTVLMAQPGHVARLWFANPLVVVALLALPWRLWPLGLGLSGALYVAASWAATRAVFGAEPAYWAMSLRVLPAHWLEIGLAAALLRRVDLDVGVLLHPERLAKVLWAGSLLPICGGAILGAWLLSSGVSTTPARDGMAWFQGGLIGSVAVLPLSLVVFLQGWLPLRQAVCRVHILVMLAAGAWFTWLAAAHLPKPFIMMALAPLLMAACTQFVTTAFATLLTALIGAVLIDLGVLELPPSFTWWGDALFYVSFLATLVPGLFFSTLVDGRAAFLQQLQASERRFRTLYTKTPAMLHSFDRDGLLVSVSDLWLHTMGYQAHEVLGRPSTDFLTQESAARARAVIIPRSLRDGRCDDVDLQAVTREGRVLDIRMSAVWEYDNAGAPLRTMAVMQDVTENKQLAARSHFAEHDPLTGLPNRVLLKDRLDRNCAHHARHGGSFAVGFLDLDHFKAVNDTHGHEAGDVLLKKVAQRLQAALRSSDTVCRLAGDEFVLLFTALDDMEDLHALVDKVLAKVAQPCTLDLGPSAPTVEVACSLGIAVFPRDGKDAQSLLTHADQAMYAAKAKGRNRCEFFVP